MRGTLPVLRPAGLRRDVAEALRNALLEGTLQPGEELSDSALATQFKVSRGPVREALLILAEEGLVNHNHNRGFHVPRFQRGDLEQIAQVRLPLEVLALELARESVTEADLSELNARKRDLLATFCSGGLRACARPDLAFHSKIWETAGNPWLALALGRICAPAFAYTAAHNLGRRDHSLELMDDMHQRLIDFLARRTTASAQDCVRFHLALS